jgi:hypothetical protein
MFSKQNKIFFTIPVLIGLITILVYLPAFHNDFVNWDDGEYVYKNPYIQSVGYKTIQWMFTTFHASNWHPLTWMSHAVDWGLTPGGIISQA